MSTTAMNVHRFGKVVTSPDILGIAEVDEVPVPDELAEKLEGAIRDGDPQQLAVLLGQVPEGARVSQSPTKKGESLLHLAAEWGYAKCCKALLEEGKIPVDLPLRDKTQAIHHAASYAHEAAFSYLVESGADVEAKNVHGETPLHLCSKAKEQSRGELYSTCIARLIELKANMESKDNQELTPLLKAAQAGQLNVVKTLLRLKAYALSL